VHHAAGIRTIIVRQERVGLHMADAVSRMTRGIAQSLAGKPALLELLTSQEIRISRP